MGRQRRLQRAVRRRPRLDRPLRPLRRQGDLAGGGGLLGAAAKEKHQMTLSLFHWTGFEQVPADFDQVLAKTRKAYPPPPSSAK